jgi:hypothetical protein
MKTPQAKRPITEQIPVECLDVTQIKDYPVALRDRTFVIRVVAKNLKEFIGGSSSTNESDVMVVAGADCGGESSHGSFPSI